MDLIIDPALALYLPLYELEGGSFASRDARGHLCQVNGALWRPNGRYFDGTDDFINAGNPACVNFGAGDFSIEMWACDMRVSGDSTFLSKGYTMAGCNGNYIVRSHASLGLEFRVLDGAVPKLVVTYIGYAAVRNDWHHIVITRLSGEVKMYIDGVLRTEGSYSGNIGDNAYSLWLGRTPHTGAEYHKGLTGEARFYTRCLAPQEVTLNYLVTKWRYR